MFKKYLSLVCEGAEVNHYKVITYQGRFSPPTKAHLYVYQNLCDEFGSDNVYVLTADPKVIDDKNPFTFAQKKEMLIAAGIQPEKIKQMRGSAYKWESVASSIGVTKFDSTALVMTMGAKDAGTRLTGKYMIKYKPGETMLPMTKHGYVKVLDNMNIEGTDVPVNASSVREAIKNKDFNIIKQNVEPGVFNWLQKEGII